MLIIILLLSIFITCIHGMETNDFSVIYYDTKINIRKESLLNADNTIDFLVVGYNEQWLLRRSSSKHSCEIGKIRYSNRNIVYEKNQAISSDRYYNIFTYENELHFNRKLRKNAQNKELPCKILNIVEPMLIPFCDCNNHIRFFEYIVTPPPQYRDKVYIENAIPIASKDLAYCYERALNAVIKKLGNKENKNIAFSTLSTTVGFPNSRAALITIKTIRKFIKNNQKKYKSIQFFVHESDFVLYERLLLPLKNIYLLYCAYNEDKETILTLFPRTIIEEIVQLIELID